MKKYLFICLFLLGLSQIDAYAQKEFTVTADSTLASQPHDAPEEGQALVIIASHCQLTFESTMDDKVNVVKQEKQGSGWIYHLKFPTSFRRRQLIIRNDTYKAHFEKLSLKSGDIFGLQVSDPLAKELTELESLRDEADALFNKCHYTEAKEKYQEALSSFDDQKDSAEDKANVSARLNKALECIECKIKADDFYNSGKWTLAFKEYEKIVGLNVADKESKEKMAICKVKRIDEPRILTGIVRNASGALVSGATVIPGVDSAGKGGKTEFPDHLAVRTDASGRFYIQTTYRTTKLKCWKENASFGAMEVDVYDDIVNIALRTGTSSSSSSTASSTSTDTKSSIKETETKSSSSNTKSSSTKPAKRKSEIKRRTLK